MADAPGTSPAPGAPPAPGSPEHGSPEAGSPAALAATLDRELDVVARELTEMEMLVGQARIEAGRLDQKRIQATERLASLGGQAPADIVEANSQAVALTRRAAVMEAQLDVLAGKQKTLERFRESITRVRDALAGLAEDAGSAPVDFGSVRPMPVMSPAVGRVVLAAQEDLRRDIARAMHDGPAQSLTNIVLQAQIVERLLDRDPTAARAEARELIEMVQRTLEATKTFIFDVRPMVLDDLGLVPTLRRVARDRSRRTQVAVEFESIGRDRRLPMELESAIFRVADEAVGCLVGANPEKVTLTTEWGDELEVTIRAIVPVPVELPEDALSADMPAALRAMVDDRRERAAAIGTVAVLTPAVRREIGDRAAAAGGRVEFAADGHGVTARFPIPATFASA